MRAEGRGDKKIGGVKMTGYFSPKAGFFKNLPDNTIRRAFPVLQATSGKFNYRNPFNSFSGNQALTILKKNSINEDINRIFAFENQGLLFYGRKNGIPG